MRPVVRIRRILAQALGLGILVAAYSPHSVAEACGAVGPPALASVLGVDVRRPAPAYALPSNAAGLEDLGGERFFVGAVELTRVPEGTTSYGLARGSVAVSGTPDLIPPTLEGLDAMHVEETACSGCAYGSADASRLTLTVRASDETAPFEQLSIAVHLGETEEAALSASTTAPDFWALADADGALWVYLAADDTAEYVVIRVFDQAGNASEPSRPVLITR